MQWEPPTLDTNMITGDVSEENLYVIFDIVVCTYIGRNTFVYCFHLDKFQE
jgi:hypothetical protein